MGLLTRRPVVSRMFSDKEENKGENKEENKEENNANKCNLKQ